MADLAGVIADGLAGGWGAGVAEAVGDSEVSGAARSAATTSKTTAGAAGRKGVFVFIRLVSALFVERRLYQTASGATLMIRDCTSSGRERWEIVWASWGWLIGEG